MLYFLYHKGYETGENLAEVLSKKINDRSFTPITSLRRLPRKKIANGDSLIRWGSTRRKEKDDIFIEKGGRVLNLANSIIRNTNKFNSLRTFRNHGVNVPVVHVDKYKINKFPVLGRNTSHHGGLDIVIIKGSSIRERNNYDKIPNKDFYSEFIPSK